MRDSIEAELARAKAEIEALTQELDSGSRARAADERLARTEARFGKLMSDNAQAYAEAARQRAPSAPQTSSSRKVKGLMIWKTSRGLRPEPAR